MTIRIKRSKTHKGVNLLALVMPGTHFMGDFHWSVWSDDEHVVTITATPLGRLAFYMVTVVIVILILWNLDTQVTSR